MKTLLLAIIALVSTSCHTSYELSERRFQVTSDFTDAEFAIMQAEVDHLCDLTSHCIYISRETHQNKIIREKFDDQDWDNGGYFAVWSDDSRYISIGDGAIKGGGLASTFRHEIGHAAGCYGNYNDGHLKDPGNVMYWRVSDVDWTDADLDCIEEGSK